MSSEGKNTQQPCCVGIYLARRLEQLGLRHLFAVPGDYTSDLLELLDESSTLERVAACNELNAAYAADGYARYHGLAALAVTSGVGALSALNGVGGAYVEQHPVIVIVGTLSTSSALEESQAGRLFHHQLELRDTNVEAYRCATCYQTRIVDPARAPEQIDAAIVSALTEQRPVLIEISEDCYRLRCAAPEGLLTARPRFTPLAELRAQAADNKHARSIVDANDAALQGVTARFNAARRPIFWLGHELATQDLQESAAALLEHTATPFVTSLLGKSVLGEETPGFLGVHEGVFTPPSTAAYLAEADLVVALGVWNTDINMLNDKSAKLRNPAPILAAKDVVVIDEEIFVHVGLGDLLAGLRRTLEPRPWPGELTRGTFLQPVEGPPETPVSFDAFFGALDRALSCEDRLVADIGISANGASASLYVPRAGAYQIQGIWASIGWSVPAGFGASFVDDRRTVVIVGDGAFKLTCQEMSSMARYHRNVVVFVLNNGVYGVEQMFLDPAPYQDRAASFEAANVLQRWSYPDLLRGFAGEDGAHAASAVIRTFRDLEETLARINAASPMTWLVDVQLDPRDYPSAWSVIVND